MTSAEFKDPSKAVRLLTHECERVLSDRLVSDTDLAKFATLSQDVAKKHFGSMPMVRTWPCCRAAWVHIRQGVHQGSQPRKTFLYLVNALCEP